MNLQGNYVSEKHTSQRTVWYIYTTFFFFGNALEKLLFLYVNYTQILNRLGSWWATVSMESQKSQTLLSNLNKTHHLIVKSRSKCTLTFFLATRDGK